ncbi:MAG: preprotein translocase subunit SecE [Gammaproteobacteria bacterium]|nr:preprotein translocase subunit SecE [Gammaproteobacteria bacterium]
MATTKTTDRTEGFDLLDRVKWLGVFAVLTAGVIGNWYFGETSLLLRALVLVGLALLALYLLYLTKRGKQLWELANLSRAEIRRVVWPTREVTLQTTLIVIALILVVALILWGLDSALSWGVKQAIG